MVLPLLLMGAGYGLQAYGSAQRTAAMDRAQAIYDQYLHRMNAEQSAADAGMTRFSDQAQQKYMGQLTDLTNNFTPEARLPSYQSGAGAARTGIRDVLAQVNGKVDTGAEAQAAGAPSSLFQNSLASEGGRADTATGLRTAVAADAQGLGALGRRDAGASFEFQNNASTLNRRIVDAMRAYQYGQALRDKGMAQAGNQNEIDQMHAANKGSALMLLGGLMSGAGQYGSMFGGQPTSAQYTTPAGPPSAPAEFNYDAYPGATDLQFIPQA